MNDFKQRLKLISALTVLYFAAGKLGLSLAFVHPSASTVWPCSGIAVGALILFGFDLWPGVLLGAFLVNLTTAGTVATSASIAMGNTAEALTGAYMVVRFAGGRNAMRRSPDIFKFAFLGGMASSIIAATVGAGSLLWSGFATPLEFIPIWCTWWLGDAVGIIIVGPLLLLWNSSSVIQWRLRSVLEAAGLLVCLVLIGMFVFTGLFTSGNQNYPLEFLCVPFLIWAASRFGQREAALATLVLSVPAIWGTLNGFGPFAREQQNESLLLLQAFLSVCAVMTMVLASEVAERRRAETEARILAGVDRLTGLGNYRKLIDTLELEIKRAERTNRTFVVLLLDLDGLKMINDIHGHPVGNRALCRLANILQIHCRGIDTAARYGGDEFAIVLPECGLEFGRTVADRISDRLAKDGETPELSVSVGFAVWPHHGTSVDALFREADRRLYDMKHRHHGAQNLSS